MISTQAHNKYKVYNNYTTISIRLHNLECVCERGYNKRHQRSKQLTVAGFDAITFEGGFTGTCPGTNSVSASSICVTSTIL